MTQANTTSDLVIIGGGVMGLMTAYYASEFVQDIVVLESRAFRNNKAASFSFTRSMRTDYLDPFYARLANEARELWLELQQISGKQFLNTTGCLNLVKQSITPDFEETYGARSYKVIADLGFGPEKLAAKELKAKFPQFDTDAGYLDPKGGYFDLTAVADFLEEALKERGVKVLDNTETTSINSQGDLLEIVTNQGVIQAKKLAITAGMWTKDVIKLVEGCDLELPISLDKPKECKYFYPDKDNFDSFLPVNFPVFAYLDIGIYGHPIFDRSKGAVKISYYNPPDLEAAKSPTINSINDFIDECLPILRDAPSEDVTDADRCSYDLVSDDNFILGRLPGFDNIVIGTGWRGTGYKFSPLIGKTLSELVRQKDTTYDISTFSPGRFVK